MAVLFLTSTAQAQIIYDVTWGGGTGNITDANWSKDLTFVSLDGFDSNLNIDGGKEVTSVVNVNNNANHHDINISVGDTLNVMNGRTLKVSAIGDVGSITNAGLLSLSATDSTTSLEIASGTFTVSGPGTITLGDNGKNRILGDDSDNGLINAVDHTIQGAGELGTNSLVLTNAGKIIATGTNPLIIDVTGASFTNQGTLRASGTGGLHLADTSFTNSKSVEINSGSHLTLTATSGTFTQSGSGSSTALNNGTLTASKLIFQSGGVLSGIGTINGGVENSGTIAPGVSGVANGVGILAFNNSLTLTNTSILRFDLGGTGATAYDKLVAPTVTLNGSLVLTFVNNFQNTVTASDTFTLISTTNADGLRGLFTSLPNGSILGTADGLGFFTVNYTGNSLTISNFSPVPEPSTYALFGTGLLALAAFRRRRRRRGCEICK